MHQWVSKGLLANSRVQKNSSAPTLGGVSSNYYLCFKEATARPCINDVTISMMMDEQDGIGCCPA
jgi:hypothetical protein